jgi:hypothetical protein
MEAGAGFSCDWQQGFSKKHNSTNAQKQRVNMGVCVV